MSDEILKNIEEKLDLIIKVVVYYCFQEKTQGETILSLKNMGLETNQIAQALNVKSNLIHAEISRARKREK